ncbi:universal stress protein [Paraconexibacter sp.]|uniref:universal stress protein n=1 Tax=Paraconexibacter sp. TaxID=2949640 RepID=UPI00356692B7
MNALIGFDESADAVAALHAATALLPPAAATVLHVRGVPHGDESPVEEAREEAESLAIADRGAALVRSAGWRADSASTSSFGGAWDQILRVADEVQAEVIVLGARGLKGLPAVLGSVSDAVVHRASQPTLVVPSPGDGEQVPLDGPVLVAYDGTPGARAALDAATTLISSRELLVCHVGGAGEPDADPVVTEAIDLARAAGARARAVPALSGHAAPGLSGRAWRALADTAQEHGAAVVVVGSRGRSAASEVVLGSVAMGVLHHAKRPVIVAPPAA